ncbi:hypothetical protein EJ110_NYTH59130 [Nymphaea thermarum]|nr:hypothetical protein EJ110_NYTH59130 [Nymphaea thermarum]
MAEEIAPKTDVAIDAGIAPKSENLPVQVTPIRLTKDNYLSWSAALEIGITSRGRLPYITGDKPAPSKTDPQWANWALEDSQVKVWIISSVSADIQPLILRKPTSFEMWNVLARMYGRKKRVLRTYQIKRSIYALKQGDLSVASYYAALKTKWEELDYHVEDNWDCGSDHARHWEKPSFSLEACVMNLNPFGVKFLTVMKFWELKMFMHVWNPKNKGAKLCRLIPAVGVVPRPSLAARPCPASALLGDVLIVTSLDTADFCWDLHLEKRLVRGRPPSSRRGPLVQESNQGGSLSSEKSRLSQDQIKELQAYIGRLSTTPEDTSTSDGAKDSQMERDTVSEGRDSQMGGAPVEEQSCGHLFGQSSRRLLLLSESSPLVAPTARRRPPSATRRLSVRRLQPCRPSPLCPSPPVVAPPVASPPVASSRDARRLSAASRFSAAAPPSAAHRRLQCCLRRYFRPALPVSRVACLKQRRLLPCAACLTTLHADFFSASSAVAFGNIQCR